MTSGFRSGLFVLIALGSGLATATADDLAYLSENNPWAPHTTFPRLTTPQWVGEEGVEAVVILAIDDMRDSHKYESYFRPILQRLKAIDGRARPRRFVPSREPDSERAPSDSSSPPSGGARRGRFVPSREPDSEREPSGSS